MSREYPHKGPPCHDQLCCMVECVFMQRDSLRSQLAEAKAEAAGLRELNRADNEAGKKAEARARAAEAENARLREALQECLDDESVANGHDSGALSPETITKARAALSPPAPSSEGQIQTPDKLDRLKRLEAVAEAAERFLRYTPGDEKRKDSAEEYMSRRVDLGEAIAALGAASPEQ